MSRYRQSTPYLLPVTECKKCGSNEVAWRKSKKGNWCLLESSCAVGGLERPPKGQAWFVGWSFHECASQPQDTDPQP